MDICLLLVEVAIWLHTWLWRTYLYSGEHDSFIQQLGFLKGCGFSDVMKLKPKCFRVSRNYLNILWQGRWDFYSLLINFPLINLYIICNKGVYSWDRLLPLVRVCMVCQPFCTHATAVLSLHLASPRSRPRNREETCLSCFLRDSVIYFCALWLMWSLACRTQEPVSPGRAFLCTAVCQPLCFLPGSGVSQICERDGQMEGVDRRGIK